MEKLWGRRSINLPVTLVLLLLLTLVFTACNAATLTSGTIVEKTMGEPLLFSLGQLKMIDPSRPAVSFVFVVKNGDTTAKIYVSEQEYYRYSVGDWYASSSES